MNFIRWIRSLLSYRGRSLSRYRSGMTKADKHDYRGAIADYSATIESDDTPADVVAMAMYNRALAYSAIHETDKASEDLEAVLKMPALSERVKAAALRRQKRIRQRETREQQDS
jgi:tetratricopeptide (TPR) repeat protein